MLSIVIPCYNEEEIITQSLDKVVNFLDKESYVGEIIVVNNASTDNTLEKLNEFKNNQNIFIFNETKKGKGNAIKKGLQETKHNKILILDADLSTDITQFNKDWLNLEETVFIGSRYFGEEIKTPKIRKLSGNILNFLIRLIFKLEIRDTQCGFKFIATRKKEELCKRLTTKGFLYDLDLILTSIKLGMSIKEVPIKYIYDKNSSVSLLKDPFFMLLEIYKLAIKHK